MKNFYLRRVKHDDFESVNQLYKTLTGRDRTRDQHIWEWQNGPSGPGVAWVIEETATSRVVAHHGVIPVPIRMNGEVLICARTENTMVDPLFKGKFPYHAFEAQALRENLKIFPAILTTSGKRGPGAVRKRLGYKVVGQWRTHTISRTPGYFLCRLLGKDYPLISKIIAGLRPSALIHGPTLMSVRDGEEIENLWKSSIKTEGFGPERTAAYLNWRFRDHPYRSSEFYIAKHQGEPFGYAAISEIQLPNGIKDLDIQDIFVQDRTEESYIRLLRVLAARWWNEPARLFIRTLERNEDPLYRAVRSLAPRSELDQEAPEVKELLVRSDLNLAFTDLDVTSLLIQGI